MPRLEHLGVAVRDAEAAVALYERLFGYAPYKREVVEEQGVETIFLDAGGAKLELLRATRPDSPVARHLEKRGAGLHHLAFEVRDLRATMEHLRSEGFRLLSDEPRRGADEKLIVFVHPKDTGGVLVEFCQRTPEPLEPAFAPLRGGQIAYYPGGQAGGPPLVVLHAALGSTELETRRLLPYFDRHFKTIAVDFASHGRSSAFDREELTLAFFAEAVPAVLDAAGIERAHVFGFSMGGSAALHLALRHPERVDRLVVHGMNVQWDAGEVETMTGAMASPLAGDAPRWAERLAETHGDDWQDLVRRMIAFTEALPDHYLPDDELTRIAAPTLVSAGDADRYFRLEHALGLWRALPDARLAVHPGLDHPIQGVDPERFAALVTGFLRDV
ncbi:MAG: methylmalonyl-CoA epimerase [Bacteroidota bacterium]